jgi:hypothetical protein
MGAGERLFPLMGTKAMGTGAATFGPKIREVIFLNRTPLQKVLVTIAQKTNTAL